MFAIIDHYAHHHSWLHRWHPVVKIVCLLAAIAVIVSLKSPWLLGLALAGCWALALTCSVPARFTLKRQKIAVLLASVVFLVAWLGGAAQRHWHIGGLAVPVEPLVAGLVLALKVSAVLVLTVPLLATQPFFVFLESLRRLGLPRRLVSMLLLMSRYNLVLADRMQSTMRAARMRGLQLSASPARLKPLGGIFGSTILQSLEQAERVEQAMQLRGFDGGIRVSWPYRLGGMDVVKAAAVLACVGGLLAWDLWR